MEGEKFAFFFFRLYAICSFINIDQFIRREKKTSELLMLALYRFFINLLPNMVKRKTLP